jgi:hypothetical protein
VNGVDAEAALADAVAVGVLVARRLGCAVGERVFVSRRRALTCGLRLADGRGIVAKLHPAGGLDASWLRAAQSVQRHLAAGGFPCPLPLLGPEPLDGRLVTVETLLDVGRAPDPHLAADRRAVAEGLAQVVSRCSALGEVDALDAERMRELPDAPLWPAPADPRLRFDDGPEGAWIDAVGARARTRRRAGTGPPVVGHGDWHIEHVRLGSRGVAAVYDWDSAMLAPEPFLVGSALGGFTAGWRLDEPAVPSFALATAFVGDYESARPRRFDRDERVTALCHWVEMTAFAARVERAREQAGLAGGRRYRDELAAHAEAVLRDA